MLILLHKIEFLACFYTKKNLKGQISTICVGIKQQTKLWKYWRKVWKVSLKVAKWQFSQRCAIFQSDFYLTGDLPVIHYVIWLFVYNGYFETALDLSKFLKHMK